MKKSLTRFITSPLIILITGVVIFCWWTNSYVIEPKASMEELMRTKADSTIQSVLKRQKDSIVKASPFQGAYKNDSIKKDTAKKQVVIITINGKK